MTTVLAGMDITASLLNDLGGNGNLFSVQSYGATGNGTTDDTAAIQATITAATATTGNVVYFPPGVYVISAPLVVTSSGLTLLGSGPGATMGGGGSGSGSWAPRTPATITGTLLPGAVIAPSSSFAQGSAHVSACILIDASSAEVDRVTVERINFYGGNAGSTTIHGVATYGGVNAAKITNCVFVVFYSASSHGIYLVEASSVDADGTFIDTCLAQFIGGDGFHLGPFGDGTIHNCHAQEVGGYGFWISNATGYSGGAGGNIRVLNCRGDLAGYDGFFFNVSCGGYSGMIQVDNCSTQRNYNNGFHMAATAATETCPVYLSNCVAQGDGVDDASAGYRINGPIVVSMTNCSCHMNNGVDGGKYPIFGITCAASTQAPLMVTVVGGLFNAYTAWDDIINAPTYSTVSGVHSLDTNQLAYNSTLTARSSL